MLSRHTWIWMEACSFESAGDRRGRGGEVAGSWSGEGTRPQAARVRVPGEKTRSRGEPFGLGWGRFICLSGPRETKAARGLKDPGQQEEEKKVRSVRGVARFYDFAAQSGHTGFPKNCSLSTGGSGVLGRQAYRTQLFSFINGINLTVQRRPTNGM